MVQGHFPIPIQSTWEGAGRGRWADQGRRLEMTAKMASLSWGKSKAGSPNDVERIFLTRRRRGSSQWMGWYEADGLGYLEVLA